MSKHVRLAKLNSALAKGRTRAEAMLDDYVEVLTPILNRMADEAARNFEEHATDYLTAAGRNELVAAAVSPDSTMVAVYPRVDEAEALAVGGEAAEVIHCTLAFLGSTEEDDLRGILDALRSVAATHAPLVGEVGGVGRFDDNGDGEPGIALPDVPGLVELRQSVVEALHAAGVDYGRDHDFQPHLTISYGEGAPADSLIGQPLHFDDLVVARGDVRYSIPLHGVPAVTAAAPPPSWGAPTPNQVIDVDALVAMLRTKTDPVRLALIETMMKTALSLADIAWDATNPFTAKVLAQAASQIVNIATTTQLNVMRIISTAYEQGLSIPDTASAIRVGMREATPARAMLIARTELAGAVNGGSLAATQIVSGATGDQYFKEWLTAPGAKDPRHEDYDGLDGQTVPLDGYFDVGGEQLQFPGDPDGSPEEVCNCRCTMAYVDSLGNETDAGVEAEG